MNKKNKNNFYLLKVWPIGSYNHTPYFRWKLDSCWEKFLILWGDQVTHPLFDVAKRCALSNRHYWLHGSKQRKIWRDNVWWIWQGARTSQYKDCLNRLCNMWPCVVALDDQLYVHFSHFSRFWWITYFNFINWRQ